MEEKVISVIVPVYKTEAYLRQCVDIIRNQTYRNLEIILVNDGSPDGCGALCEELARKDSRIRVIHKENGGLSSARNAGLDAIRGEVVSFVDSDDWIAPEMYTCLYSLMQQHQAQIAAGGLQTDTGKHYNTAYPLSKAVDVFTSLEALREVTINQRITNSVCDKLWDSALFDNIRFPEGVLFEDIRTTYKLLEKTNRVVYTPQPMYIYRVMEESISRGKFHPRMLENVYAVKERADYYQNHFPELYGHAVAEYIRIGLMQIWAARKTHSCAEQRKELIRELKKPMPTEAIKLINWQNKVKLGALSVGVPVFYLVMAINEVLSLTIYRRDMYA